MVSVLGELLLSCMYLQSSISSESFASSRDPKPANLVESGPGTSFGFHISIGFLHLA